jgi:hypothetical protein
MTPRIFVIGLGAVCTFSLLLFATCSQAQIDREFGAFRAVTVDGDRIDGKAGTLSGAELQAVDRSNNPIRVSLSELEVLDIQTGSKSAKYGLVGGLCGALLVGGAIAEVESDPDYELRGERVLPVSLVTVGVGALVGAVIGHNRQTWEHVELHSSTSGSAPGSTGVGLAFRF